MLSYLKGEAKVVRSPKGRRKLRLFACGCCRRVWRLVEDPRSRRMVELSELSADGLVDPSQLAKAEAAARAAKEEADRASAGQPSMARVSRVGAAVDAALHTAARAAYEAARLASALSLCSVGGGWSVERPNPVWDAEEKRQTDLLRDIFGNPFCPVTPDPTWLTSTVVPLAEGAYEETALDRLLVLADALEE